MLVSRGARRGRAELGEVARVGLAALLPSHLQSDAGCDGGLQRVKNEVDERHQEAEKGGREGGGMCAVDLDGPGRFVAERERHIIADRDRVDAAGAREMDTCEGLDDREFDFEGFLLG